MSHTDTGTPDTLGATIAKLLDPERRRMVLATGAAQAENDYRNDPSAAKLAAWEGALAKLEAFETELVRQAQGVASAPLADVAAPAQPQTCATTREAAEYLRGLGWKVGKTKIAAAVQDGLLARTAQGLFAKQTLEAWADKNCTLLAGPALDSRDERISKYHEQFLQARAAKEQSNAALKKMEERLQSGEFIRAADAYRLMAQLTAQLRADLDNFIYGKVPESVKICRGDEGHIPDLIEWWLAAKAEWMNRYLRAWRDQQPMLIPRAAVEEALRELSR